MTEYKKRQFKNKHYELKVNYYPNTDFQDFLIYRRWGNQLFVLGKDELKSFLTIIKKAQLDKLLTKKPKLKRI
jgi:hypothetical protein